MGAVMLPRALIANRYAGLGLDLESPRLRFQSPE